MMLKGKTAIGPGLLFTFMFSSIFGYEIMQLPLAAAKYGGPNEYWGLVVAFGLSTIVILQLVALQKRFPGKSVVQYLPDVVGTVPGKILGIIYILFLIILLSWTVRAVAEQFNTYFLLRTPAWVIMALTLLSIMYLAYTGIEGITRLASFVFPLSFIFILLSTAISFQFFDPDKVRPVFYVQGYEIPIVALESFYSFFALAVLFVVLPYLTEQNKALKTLVTANTLAFAFTFLLVIAAIGTFGAKGVLRYSWPIMELIKNTNIPFIFQTFGLFFAVAWLSQLFIAAGGFYFAAAQATSELLKGLNYKTVILAFFPAIFILSNLVPSTVSFREWLGYLRLSGFAVVFGFPLLLWILTTLLKRGDLKNAH